MSLLIEEEYKADEKITQKDLVNMYSNGGIIIIIIIRLLV